MTVKIYFYFTRLIFQKTVLHITEIQHFYIGKEELYLYKMCAWVMKNLILYIEIAVNINKQKLSFWLSYIRRHSVNTPLYYSLV